MKLFDKNEISDIQISWKRGWLLFSARGFTFAIEHVGKRDKKPRFYMIYDDPVLQVQREYFSGFVFEHYESVGAFLKKLGGKGLTVGISKTAKRVVLDALDIKEKV